MTCVVPGCARARAGPAAFCRVHVRAPAAQRGGWLSAAQRKAKMELDADAVFHRLWMGSKPPVDRVMASLDAVVLCADSYQPVMPLYKGKVFRCPIRDAEPTEGELALAMASAAAAAKVWRAGGKVLVTCYAGLNRSGLVTGLILLDVTKKSSAEVIEMIRAARGADALFNTHFVRVLEGVSALERARRAASR